MRGTKGVNFFQNLEALIIATATENDIFLIECILLCECYLKQGAIGIWSTITHGDTARTCVPKDKVLVAEESPTIVYGP